MKKNKGFTLIELLVVIAIIGILAAIVLVSLGGARNRARDARITADMNQVRSTAEIINSDTNTYANVACSAIGAACTCSNGDVDRLCEDIYAQNNSSALAIRVNTNSNGYCAYGLMNNGKYWCVDSGLRSSEDATSPAAAPAACAVACVAANTCACDN